MRKLKLIGLKIQDWLLDRWVYALLAALGFLAGAFLL